MMPQPPPGAVTQPSTQRRFEASEAILARAFHPAVRSQNCLNRDGRAGIMEDRTFGRGPFGI